MFSGAVARAGHCRQTSLACVGSTRSVLATVGLPPLMARVLHCSGSQLLYMERALSCVWFQFSVFHKSTDSDGPAFCAFPARAAQAARSLMGTLSPGSVRLLPCRPNLSLPAHRSCCVCSGELVSSHDPPGRDQPSRISGSLWLETGILFAVW